MSRHYVSHIDRYEYATPSAYAGHCKGYSRAELVSSTISPAAVHMGVGIARIEPGGQQGVTAHAFEKGFFVLQGRLVANIDSHANLLSRHHYGLIGRAAAYSFCNVGDEPALLLEMMAPQPQEPGSDFQDTWFEHGEVCRTADVPDLRDPRVSKRLGMFDESSLPPPGPISGAGVRSSAVSGVTLVEFIDRALGAQYSSMFLVQYAPGGVGGQHDHPHEESYYLLAGRVTATLDGEVYDVGPGSIIWTGVGCFHGFENRGTEPVRWIETQAPLPMATDGFRFRRDWDSIAERSS